jgi:hypothetical protein
MSNPQSSPIWNPFAWLVTLTILFAVESAAFTYHGEEIPHPTESLWVLSFSILAAWWVYSDRRARAFGAPFEFDAFVVFAWPILVPYYLHRTRGRVGLALGAGVWLLYLVPSLAAWGVYLALAN